MYIAKIPIVTPTNDLLIILDGNNYNPSEIIDDFTLINDADCMRVHFQ